MEKMQSDPQLAKVDALLTEGALDEANNLESMLQTAPARRDLLCRLADVALVGKRPRAALSYADRLVDLDNTDNDALFYKAKTELAPDSPIVWTKLAGVSSELCDADEAQSCLERATALDAGNAGTWQVLGGLYAECWKFDKAEFCLQQAIALDPRQDACIACLDWSATNWETRAARSLY
jgi:tetratricopeptide (TPR) repeat protein